MIVLAGAALLETNTEAMFAAAAALVGVRTQCEPAVTPSIVTTSEAAAVVVSEPTSEVLLFPFGNAEVRFGRHRPGEPGAVRTMLPEVSREILALPSPPRKKAPFVGVSHDVMSPATALVGNLHGGLGGARARWLGFRPAR